MPISTSFAPHQHATSQAATPGQNSDAASKHAMRPEPRRQTRPASPARPAPPTPPAAAPSDAGTQNDAGSTARRSAPLEQPGERLDEQEDVQADDHARDADRRDGRDAPVRERAHQAAVAAEDHER